MQLSIVLPVHNEEDNLKPLFDEIAQVMRDNRYDYEIIFVDDGSSDKSLEILKELSGEHGPVKVVSFKRNFGQTAAMSAGIDYAEGDVIVLMDSDRQNDPSDIPRFLQEIEKGNDVVVGWRKNRQDRAINRKLPSKMANWLVRKIGGVKVNDLGCSLKAFKKDLIKQIKLYGEMHRFIPLYTTSIGGKLSEIVVNHRPRVAGETKYGINRTFKVILDLITVKFLMKYSTKPMYFFGGTGIVFLILSLLTTVFLLAHKFLHDIHIIQSPLLIITAVFILIGFNFILMGLISEMLMRTYFESQGKKSYIVKEEINFP